MFNISFFLIRPKAHCLKNGIWEECSYDTICDNDLPYYFDVPKEFNFVTEFGWYCDQSTSAFFTGTAFFSGTTVSIFIVTGLSDIVGRLPLLIVGTSGMIFTLVVLICFASPYMCFACSFLIGFFTMANNSSSFNFLADSIPLSKRKFFPATLNMAWALAQIAIILTMYTGIHWRTMCLGIICFVSTFFIYLYWLRESPKFYYAQGKLFKAQTRLNNIARINRAQSVILSLPKEKEEKVTFSVRTKMLCRDKTMLINIILVTILFSVSNMTSYALQLNLENVSGNPFLTGIFLAFAQVAACFLSSLSLKWVEPKYSVLGCITMGIIGMAGLVFLWDNPYASIVFLFCAGFGATSNDNLMYTLSGLIFPAKILGTALGAALIGTRFGNMTSKPLILIGAKNMCILALCLWVGMPILPFLLRTKEQKEETEKPLTTES
jgi:MFS family permease